MKTIDRVMLKALHDDVIKALKDVGDKYGVVFSQGGGSFTAHDATIKIDIATKQSDGKVFDRSAADFQEFAQSFGLIPEDLGRTFVVGVTTYTICGLNRKARKYPILAKDTEGTVYTFSSKSVSARLGKAC